MADVEHDPLRKQCRGNIPRGRGYFERPSYSTFGDVAEGVARVQVEAFLQLNAKEPNKWALAQGENSFFLRNGLIIPNVGTSVDLHRAIPVPNVDVPLDDILSFKAKRQDELLALRDTIDGICQSLEKTTDADSMRHEMDNIDRACNDAIKVVREWQIPFKLTSMKCSFEARPLVVGSMAVAAYEAASAHGLPLTEAAIAALGGAAVALLPSFKIGGDFGWRGLRPTPHPYRYVAHYHKEIFGR